MKKIRTIISLTLFVVLPLLTIADPPPPPGSGGTAPGGGQTPVGAPIDGGFGILLALGLAYGGRKLYDVYKAKNTNVAEPEN
jgi:hypothetical protein